jgi:hypothetical protein
MSTNVVNCEINDNKVSENIVDEIPVIIAKHFEKEYACNSIRKYAHDFSKKNNPKLGHRLKETFWQMDVLPSKVITDRIFRTFCIVPDDKLIIVNKSMPILPLLEI